jgi:hypothetical protein
MTKAKGMSQLEFIEQFQLPALLRDRSRWRSLRVDYHPPLVERVFTDHDGWRFNLHCIHPCKAEDALFHPHPWPSQMRVVKGRYQMKIGYGKGRKAPPVAAIVTLEEGSDYVMDDPDQWHSVRPIGEPAWSLMITGTPWGRWSPKPPDDRRLGPLADERQKEIIRFFRKRYPFIADSGVS